MSEKLNPSASIGIKGKLTFLGQVRKGSEYNILLSIHYPRGEFPVGKGFLLQVFTQGLVGEPQPLETNIEGVDGLLFRACSSQPFSQRYLETKARMLARTMEEETDDVT